MHVCTVRIRLGFAGDEDDGEFVLVVRVSAQWVLSGLSRQAGVRHRQPIFEK
jgi:hypothetical protein